MKKVLLAGAATLAITAAVSADAADLRIPVKAAPIAAPAPYFSWTGCYIGAHVGMGWGNKGTSNATDTDGFPTSFTSGASIDTTGAILGGQLGCNYSFAPSWIIGLEGSASGANIIGFANDMDGNFMHAQTSFLASITGRLGWSGWDPRVLFYVKGGGAWAHDRYQFSYSFGTQDRSGWTLGVGVEWAFAGNWSAFAEYDHYDFGTERASVSSCDNNTCTTRVDVSQRIDTVRIGVNYRFDVGFLDKAPIAARY